MKDPNTLTQSTSPSDSTLREIPYHLVTARLPKWLQMTSQNILGPQAIYLFQHIIVAFTDSDAKLEIMGRPPTLSVRNFMIWFRAWHCQCSRTYVMRMLQTSSSESARNDAHDEMWTLFGDDNYNTTILFVTGSIIDRTSLVAHCTAQ